MESRRAGGRETWHRLREWDKAHVDSERLAAGLLCCTGYEDIDPSHPLGGPDGGKDIKCVRDGHFVVAGVYFPRGQQKLSSIIKKFNEDLAKAVKNDAEEFVFVTNQELTLKKREDLKTLAKPIETEIYHLERISTFLDTPKGYPLRLEFLQLGMTIEEQLAFINDRDQLIFGIIEKFAKQEKPKRKTEGIKTVPVESDAWTYYSIHSINDQPRLMECKNCQEIFRARPQVDPFAPTTSSFFTSSGANGLRIVTCPACGKVQKYA
jgi:hypothetical protein